MRWGEGRGKKSEGGEIQKRRRAAREERPLILTPKTKCGHKT